MSSTPNSVFEYEDSSGYSPIREWRKQLRRSNPKASAKVDWLIALLEAKGTTLRFPYVSHIEGPVYELRGKTGSNTIRIYYWQQDEDIFIAASGEVKKQKKADQKLVKKALEAYQEYNEE